MKKELKTMIKNMRKVIDKAKQTSKEIKKEK